MPYMTRSAAKKPSVPDTTSTTSTDSSTAASSAHAFLRDGEISAIETWNDSIPAKSMRPKDDQDPAVEAYMQAKMALFNSLAFRSRNSSTSTSTSQEGCCRA
ncbi:hypothetical protein Tdes44962_MAKER02148 [Teratosphaeria destructans]|uniref:Uncharacterized protein n=1 Tax=Teratosphaeria destructans TaxID=418781 RepID=A0A9W7W421_9PEZI|nr:hypothetical protein Tdes44962_MAKER02148 [Teratosphaeria destructans]